MTAEDDHAAWAAVTARVAPLARDSGRLAARVYPAPRIRLSSAPRSAPLVDLPDSPAAEPPRLNQGHRLDHRQARRLRQGRLSVEAVLDLHGLHLDAASKAVIHFIHAAYREGRRCILIITGKGGRNGSGGGSIRTAFTDWIQAPSLAPLIVAVQQAAAKDGGGGAFYVYVRRNRPARSLF